jgi:hypothetical protein
MIRLIALPLAVFVSVVAYLIGSVVFAHDHERADLDGWYQGLTSRKGPCCDGPKTDALHIQNADWESRDGHYRVRIPKNGPDFARAIHGESVETEWVDVPDEAVVNAINRAGITLVWPMYGYMGNTVRCFMPGPMA